MTMLVPGENGVVFARVHVTHDANRPFDAEVLVESESPWAPVLIKACEGNEPMYAVARSDANMVYEGRWSVESADDGPEGVRAVIRSYGPVTVKVGPPREAAGDVATPPP